MVDPRPTAEDAEVGPLAPRAPGWERCACPAAAGLGSLPLPRSAPGGRAAREKLVQGKAEAPVPLLALRGFSPTKHLTLTQQQCGSSSAVAQGESILLPPQAAFTFAETHCFS